MLERTKKFSIDGKSFTANFPNIGQIIDMESLKQALTGNRYGAMASSGITSAYEALDIVDTIAFLQICVPEVSRHYDIRNYADLPADKMNKFLEAYRKEIRPWYENVMKELKNITTPENESK